jgi:uncharacterized membrane protein (DUF4010 family)
MELTAIFLKLAIALGLGLLVGIEREHVAKRLGGIRTFPMITILGALCALLAQSLGVWILAAGVISVSGLIVMGNLLEARNGSVRPGLTTEVAMLLMFGVGAYLIVGSREIAVAIGSGVAILLHLKGELHGVTKKLGGDDVRAMMQFALISFIILPILPNRTYGPYAVFNPRSIWFMVVLIVGISLTGYIAYKLFGARVGLVLSGILGGLISSTATSVSYARRSALQPTLANVGATVIAMASTILFFRVLLEIATVAPRFLNDAGPPLLTLGVLLGVASVFLWFRCRNEESTLPPQENPSELRAALVFGLIYAAVLFAVAAVKDGFGGRGLFVVAILSGLTDVDAITLSVSQLVNTDRLTGGDGWRLIVAATLSNLVFKGAIIAFLGDRGLLRRLILPFGLVLVAGIAMLVGWPR